MMFTPMIPVDNSRARRISFRKARVLAAKKFLNRSGSIMPIPAVAITPIPPSLATAAAKPDRDTPTPMPPWMIGRGAVRAPMWSAGGRRSVMSHILSLTRPFVLCDGPPSRHRHPGYHAEIASRAFLPN